MAAGQTTSAGAVDERRLLLEPQAVELLAGYDIDYPEHRLVTSSDEAEEALAELGPPVVVKVVSRDVLHKSDVGGVVTGIGAPDEARAAVECIRKAVAPAGASVSIFGYLVCRQAGPGHELIVGGLRDLTFGPAVMVGMGGVFAELLDDVAFRLAPVSSAQAIAMLGDLAGAPVLRGARGGPACDLELVAGMIAGVSRLIADRPDIQEIDLNPVRVSGHSCIALDARIIVSPGEPPFESGVTG